MKTQRLITALLLSGVMAAPALADALPPGHAGQKPFSACSLLTRQEVAAAVESAVKEGEDPSTLHTGATCNWDSADGSGCGVIVDVWPAKKSKEPDTAKVKNFRKLDGLGLEAYAYQEHAFVDPEAWLATAAARTQDKFVVISIDGEAPAAAALLKIAVGRLK